jgi:DNA-binding IclR family transcriptional regulator
MPYTYEQLKSKTIAELRDIAKELSSDAVQGYSQMNKEHLLPALCTALHIDMHEHHHASGIDKAGIKAKIRMLKQERDRALEAHDRSALKSLRRQVHQLNRQIRAHVS